MQWEKRSLFNPNMPGFLSLNDGEEYLLTMDNWELDLISRDSLIINDKIKKIQAFQFGNSPVEIKVELKTKEVIIFNFLPEPISDFIENHFSQSPYDFQGRKWNKFLNETMTCFGVYRTPAYCGGTVFQDDNYLILGKNKDTKSPSKIGRTIDAVWQTLVSEKENMIKLIMMALESSKEEAEEYLKKEFIEEQEAVITNIEPGTYYIYNIPENDKDTKKQYKDVNMEDISEIHIDMLISKNKIQTDNNIDEQQILFKEEAKKAKLMFNNFEFSSTSLKL